MFSYTYGVMVLGAANMYNFVSQGMDRIYRHNYP